MVENNKAKLLRDFKFQTDKQLLANQADTVVADMQGGDRRDNPSWQKDKEERALEDREAPRAEGTTGTDVEGELQGDGEQEHHGLWHKLAKCRQQISTFSRIFIYRKFVVFYSLFLYCSGVCEMLNLIFFFTTFKANPPDTKLESKQQEGKSKKKKK